MHFSLCGTGQSLVYIVKAFLSKGHFLKIICPDQTLCNLLAKEFRADIIFGDPTAEKVLDNARIGDSRFLVAAMTEDADNYVICQLAMTKFKVARTMALAHNSTNEEIFKQMGISVTLCLANVISGLVEEGIYEEITNLYSLENGKILSMMLSIPLKSPLIGKKRAELPVMAQSRVALIIRDGQFLEEDDIIKEEDKLVIFCSPLMQGKIINNLHGEK